MSRPILSRRLEAFARLVRSVVGASEAGPLLDYTAAYRGVILRQYGTPSAPEMYADVRLDDGSGRLDDANRRWPDLTRVPIRLPVPGVRFSIRGAFTMGLAAESAPCIVEFAGGRQAGQFISTVDGAFLDRLYVTAGTEVVVDVPGTRVLGKLYALHLLGEGDPPKIEAGPALGSSGQVQIVGHDLVFTMNLTIDPTVTPMKPAPPGVLATVTWNLPYATEPFSFTKMNKLATDAKVEMRFLGTTMQVTTTVPQTLGGQTLSITALLVG